MNSLKEINRKWFIAIGCVVAVLVVAAAVYYSPSMRFQRQQQEVSDFVAQTKKEDLYSVMIYHSPSIPDWTCNTYASIYDPVQCVGTATELRKKDCEPYGNTAFYFWIEERLGECLMMEVWKLKGSTPETLAQYAFTFNSNQYLILYQDVVFAPDADIMTGLLQLMVDTYAPLQRELEFSKYFG